MAGRPEIAKGVERLETPGRHCIAFTGGTCIASGSLAEVALAAREVLDHDRNAPVLVLDGATSEPVEVDFRGSKEEFITRISAIAEDAGGEGACEHRSEPPEVPAVPRQRAAPGRPKLGVVGREVTLLPRHWEWLNEQPGGASVTLRRLVEEARRSTIGEAALRRARDACSRFMTIMAGNAPGYEEALRALFAGDSQRFQVLTEQWPPDVRDHARRLAAASFDDRSSR